MLIKATMQDVIKERVNGTTNLYVVDAMENPIWEVSVTRVDTTTNEIYIRPFEEEYKEVELKTALESLRLSV